MRDGVKIPEMHCSVEVLLLQYDSGMSRIFSCCVFFWFPNGFWMDIFRGRLLLFFLRVSFGPFYVYLSHMFSGFHGLVSFWAGLFHRGAHRKACLIRNKECNLLIHLKLFSRMGPRGSFWWVWGWLFWTDWYLLGSYVLGVFSHFWLSNGEVPKMMYLFPSVRLGVFFLSFFVWSLLWVARLDLLFFGLLSVFFYIF